MDQAASPYSAAAGYTVKVAISPTDMENELLSWHQQGQAARIVAGYCWPWSDPRPDGSLVKDIKIGAWERPWAIKSDRANGVCRARPGFGESDSGEIRRPGAGGGCRLTGGARRARSAYALARRCVRLSNLCVDPKVAVGVGDDRVRCDDLHAGALSRRV
ncbi:DNA/RNA helicase domain-containing protein [Micromonospora vinacea]|uniref:DNA/RNA helicase domain-containing protein n=1 Tax=Micromonospora vinacea TaxID=709878 RepID=UPI003450D7EA